MLAYFICLCVLAAEIVAGRLLAKKIAHLEQHHHDLVLVINFLEAFTIFITAIGMFYFGAKAIGRW